MNVSIVAILVVLLVGVPLYFLPAIVAAGRKVTNVGSVFVINLLLGWTFVGWVVALAMAMKSTEPQR
ncbi:superinfection immunity protein [Streptomyces sp. NBC_00059]|uniref:superinfection immunity protein n=1 Tax=Streptomyces sp. NBC_00059 TaxID=2975635 RepID=UPI0022547827|nr:superinfection immunity protein [Streptomyces sp. NBC_00059]MCX5412237.1 superinfection immunity protein [Streptomyces sp. NBC_00059]